MAKQPKKAERAVRELSPFGQTLQWALDHFTDPLLLAEKSPLASPYLLGRHLQPDAAAPVNRGRALQKVLQNALERLDGPNHELMQAIIRERYFKGLTAVVVQDLKQISLSKSQYHARQREAVSRFEPLVVSSLSPAIRLESPHQEAEPLVGRQAELNRCQKALTEQKTVTVSGPGGIGKSALGAHIAQLWGQEKVLWFTVRPGLNDHLNSFVFALAYFCHQHGSSSLWQELIANDGRIRLPRLLDLVRHTLSELPVQPLVCIDEADLILPASDGNHTQFVQLLSAMRGKIPMLLLGQKVIVEGDHYEVLSGLPTLFCNLLLKQHEILLNETTLQQLHDYTEGNPLLIQLLITLHESGVKIAELLPQLPKSPSVQFLLGRILQRLDETEIGILMDLAVFHTPAPVDVWVAEKRVGYALSLLLSRRLVQQDSYGGVFLLPAFRDVIAAAIDAKKMQTLQRKAAEIFLVRGQYTLAAYHFSKTTEPAVAVWLWKEVSRQEINQGQAHTALTLFRTMQTMALPAEALDQTKLFCGLLENLVGSPAKAQADLASLLSNTPILKVEADELGGVIANNLGQFTNAKRLFDQAIQRAEHLVEVRLAHAHKGLGWMYWREQALDKAWREVTIARYEVINLEGVIQRSYCRYDEAIACFKEAVTIAESLQHHDGIAKTSQNLSDIYARLGEFAQAKAYHTLAEQTNRKMGKTMALIGMQIGRGFIANLAGDYAEAAHALKEAQKQAGAQELLTPQLSALIAQGLAEAYLGLRDLDQAEHHVQQAIDLEEMNILPDAYRTHGEILLHRGQFDLAEAMIQQSIAFLEKHASEDLYLAGYAWRALAQVCRAQQKLKSAESARAKAIALFAQINLQNEVDKTLNWLAG